MLQAHTLSVGMEGPTEAIAVASVAQEQGADVIALHAARLRRRRWALRRRAVALPDANRRRRLGGRPLGEAHKGGRPGHHRPA